MSETLVHKTYENCPKEDQIELFILYYAFLSKKFEHLPLNIMHCYRYYNVS